MARARHSVYLSGWEANRLISDDPIAAPRISALPANVLWNGAHQLWMFQTVYCTKESLENEYAAADMLGWASGRIFRRLEAAGVVRAVDWQTEPEDVQRAVTASHAELRQTYAPEDVLTLVRSGDAARLEEIKGSLMEPILRQHNCVQSGAANSLANWIPASPSAQDADRHGSAEQVTTLIAAPLVPDLQVCRPPGSCVSEEERAGQRRIEQDIERPMIPDLLSGEGPFSGPKGFEPYLEALMPYRKHYQPVNDQLFTDWTTNETALLHLRDKAEKHLWPMLHGEWLPAVYEDPSFVAEFPRLVRRAMQMRPLVELLENRSTRLLLGALPTFATWAGLQLAGHAAGLSETIASELATVVTAAGAGAVATRKHPALKLALFYQDARRL
jgi:hypothetical protein